MNKRFKKKKQTLCIRSIIYWYIKDLHKSGKRTVKVDDMIRRNGNLWVIFERDIKQVARWLRSDGFQFQFSEFIPRGLGIPGWVFWFYED